MNIIMFLVVKISTKLVLK